MPYINIFAGKLNLPLKSEDNKPLNIVSQETPKPKNTNLDQVKSMLQITKPEIKAEVTPQAPIYKFGINTREDLAKLVNGVMLSYEGYSEIELKELGMDSEKVNKLKEILLKK